MEKFYFRSPCENHRNSKMILMQFVVEDHVLNILPMLHRVSREEVSKSATCLHRGSDSLYHNGTGILDSHGLVFHDKKRFKNKSSVYCSLHCSFLCFY